MSYRTLDLTLISATGVTNSGTVSGKLNVYAVVSIGLPATDFNVQKFKTPVCKIKAGDLDPTWNINFPMQFTFNEAAGVKNRLTLALKIKAVRMFVDKNLGEVRIPIKELLGGVKSMQVVSYPMQNRSGKPKGVVSFTCRFGEVVPGRGGSFGFLGGMFCGGGGGGGLVVVVVVVVVAVEVVEIIVAVVLGGLDFIRFGFN